MNDPEKYQLHVYLGHDNPKIKIAVSNNAKYIASGGSDNKIKIWNLESGACIRTIKGHTASIQDISYSFDDRFIVSIASDGCLKIWDAELGFERFDYKVDNDSKISFNRTNHFAFVFSKKIIKVIDANTGDFIDSFVIETSEESYEYIERVIFDPNGKFLAILTHHKIHLLNLNTREIIKYEITWYEYRVIKFSDDGKFLCSSDKNGIRVINLLTQVYFDIHTFGKAPQFCFIPNSNYILIRYEVELYESDYYGASIPSTTYEQEIWDLEKNEIHNVRNLPELDSSLFLHRFQYTLKKNFFIGEFTDKIYIYHAFTGKFIMKLKLTHEYVIIDNIHSCSFDKLIFSVDNRKRYFNLITNSFSTFHKTADSDDIDTDSDVEDDNYSFDLKYAYSKTNLYKAYIKEGNIVICDRFDEQGECINFWQAHPKISAICFHNKNDLIASSCDKDIVIWDLSGNKKLEWVTKHTEEVTAICFHENLLVSGSKDKTIRVWDIEKKLHVTILSGHEGTISSICISDDMNYLITADFLGMLIFWDTKNYIQYKKIFIYNKSKAIVFKKDHVSDLPGNLIHSTWWASKHNSTLKKFSPLLPITFNLMNIKIY